MKKLFLYFIALTLFCLTTANLTAKKYHKCPEKRSVENSVKKAVEFFKANGADVTFVEINNPKSELNNPNYIFVYDLDSNCIAIGQHQDRIGKNFSKEKDRKGVYFVNKMAYKAKKNKPGWIHYRWLGSKKNSYVVRIQDPKTNKIYVLGSGYMIKEKKDKSAKVCKLKDKKKYKGIN